MTLDLRRRKIGRLICIEPVPILRRHRGSLWRCECECGREVIRSGFELIRAQKTGAEPMCTHCRSRKTGQCLRARKS